MVLFTEVEIQNKVKLLGQLVSTGTQPYVVIGVLNGGFMFFSDLVRKITNPCQLDFIQVKSYNEGKQSEIRFIKDLSVDITDKHVILVDDIFDSGDTIRYIIEHLKQKNPKNIQPVTLFKRKFANTEGTNLIYGFLLEDEKFLIGYGLDDIDGTKRNQSFITGVINDN
jgi:hypoxanthine phosphoribosyltransferase